MLRPLTAALVVAACTTAPLRSQATPAAAPAGADTLPHAAIRAEYPRIFTPVVVRDGDAALGLSVEADTVVVTPLGAVVRENYYYFVYLAAHGTEPTYGEIARDDPPAAEFRRAYHHAVTHSRGLDGAVIPLVQRYLETDGGRRPASESRVLPRVRMDELLATASGLFAPDGIRPNGRIETHVCSLVGLGSDLPVAVEAFAYAAVAQEIFVDPRHGLEAEMVRELERMQRTFASGPDEERVAGARAWLQPRMARSEALRRTLLAEYEKKRAYLPFVVSEVPAS